ncbi:MAG: glycerol-3-phosphate 1-O-acyltransferase PlsY [Lentisphaerae bacterium]|nr:glycerol-3-phosphate 1-O-acyltransferase PlsY [Lentisphaerota bacterium]
MSPLLSYCILAAACYLIGSIPFGLLIARIKGIDIRTVGSRNIGATNVFRSVGKGWGILTFACDFLKGLLPVLILPALLFDASADTAIPRLACTVFCIAGHNWTVFLRFRGGKGIATSAGALCGIAWQAVLVGLAVWLVLFVTTRYVSVASIASAVAIMVFGWGWLRADGLILPVVLTALGAAAIVKHRANIIRLVKGTEHRFEFSRRKGAK